MKFKGIIGSRWGRAALVAIPVAVVSSVLMAGVAEGAVPVSFSISGQQFKLSAAVLEGSDFSQYAGLAKDKDGHEVNVVTANIGSATLTDLCQSVVTDTPLGKVGMLLTAGGGGAKVSANGLQIAMTDLQGDASFTNIRIGVDAGSVSTAEKGTPGEFAQDASGITIRDLKQTAWSTQAGLFSLPGLHLQLTDGSKECF